MLLGNKEQETSYSGANCPYTRVILRDRNIQRARKYAIMSCLPEFSTSKVFPTFSYPSVTSFPFSPYFLLNFDFSLISPTSFIMFTHFFQADSSGARKIFDAIDEGDIGKLRAVLNPTDINRYNGETTALFHAVSNKSRKEIVKILCSVDDIDVNKGSRSGETPLSEAIRLNSADIIKLLCQNKRVNIFHKDWATKEKLEDMFESEVFLSSFSAFKIGNRGAQRT